MEIRSLDIPDVKLFSLKKYEDERGFFVETWRKEWFENISGGREFVQDNQSKSIKGTLRGLHYQINNAQGKFVRVLDGTIYDAVVDLRKSSSTFGQWVGVTLSSVDEEALWVPEGFAHGFCVTSDTALVSYKCTDYYSPNDERCLLWSDTTIGIKWPEEIFSPVVSNKDQRGLSFSECEKFS